MLAEMLGWDVPDSKSPFPAPIFLAIGYVLDLSNTPWEWAKLAITPKRVKQLLRILSNILRARRLYPGEAGSLWGPFGVRSKLFVRQVGPSEAEAV